MKTLSQLLENVRTENVSGPLEAKIARIEFDSRKADGDSVFVAMRGTKTDGHDYVGKAVENGCRAVVLEEMPSDCAPGVTYVQVKDTAAALGELSRNLYDDPSSELNLVGVTGTNGKTTIATLLYETFTAMGYKCGLLSTIRILIAGEEISATHTTPDIVTINGYLRRMADEGCRFCFMEVSSHSVVQKRIYGLTFVGGIFTNLTLDHLDFHKTFAAYRDAKKGFFDMLPKNAFGLVNDDDKNGMYMLQNFRGEKKTYAERSMADFKVKILENRFDGLLLEIDGRQMWTALVGEFNAYNLLAVYGAAVLLGADKMETLTVLSAMHKVRGRFESYIAPNGVVCVVDYAHTPDALENVMNTVNKTRTRNEQFTVVAGCGGDRDRSKRPIMARIACENADRVILTSDNPRTEDPLAILKEMETGVPAEHFKKVLVIADRYQAIKTACTMSGKGDIVLVAGKGHETYQEVNGVRSHFDDMEVLREVLE